MNSNNLTDGNVTSGYNETNTTDNYSDDYYYYDDGLEQFWVDKIRTLWQVFGPSILIVGTFSNVMVLLILRKLVSEASAFPLFFMALAVSDLLLLYFSLLPRWVGEQFGHWLTDGSETACKCIMWLEFSLTSLSAWLLVAMTAQRALNVAWPLKLKTVRPRRQALLTVLVLAVASFVFNSPALFRVTTHDPNTSCWWEVDFETHTRPALNWAEIILNSLLPSIIMIVCNCLMVRAMMLSSRRASIRSRSRSANLRGGALSQVTLTLILVSLVFIVLTLPMYITQIILEETPELQFDGPFQIWYNITSVMWICNSAVNFFLYVMTGSRFRKEGKRLFTRSEGSFSQTSSTLDRGSIKMRKTGV
nr:hypothetical protein BaRGS_006253 [Batillaria attramentaria]